MPGDDSGATLCDPGDQFWSDSGCVGAPSPAPTPAPVAQVNCEALTASVGISGFNYSIASELWNDGSLSNYKDDPTAAVIAALATITYQGESEFGTNLRNNNVGNGRVAIGPFQIQYPSLWNSITTNPQNVFGTNLKAGQTFNGNMDANITAGISILKYPYTQYGDNAAGKYIGVNIKGRNPPVDVRQKQFDKYKNALVNLFENQQCFPHN
jgi:hypothetical protein